MYASTKNTCPKIRSKLIGRGLHYVAWTAAYSTMNCTVSADI